MRRARGDPLAVEFEEDQVLVRLPKCVLVLSRTQFVQALKAGKAYRRAEALRARLALLEENSHR